MRKFAQALGVATTVAFVGAIANAATETQDFTTNPSDWMSDGGPGYGFSAGTDNTAQESGPGEAGGVVPRDSLRKCYADIDLGGVITQATPFTASGELFVSEASTADGALFISHFNAAQVGLPGDSDDGSANAVGLRILEARSGLETNFRFGAGLETQRNDGITLPYKDEGGNQILYKFDYTWDPATFTLTARILTPAGVEVATDSLTNPDVDFEINAFGLTSGFAGSDNPNQTFTVFVDGLSYTDARGGGGLLGDFNADAVVDATDIDLLCDRINAATGEVELFDVNNDGSVNMDDVNFEVTNILETKFGDTDTDGDVDLNDLGNLASGFGQPGEKRWSRGNFDCDQDVDLPDLGTLATNFDAGRAAAMAAFEAIVPEPASAAMLGVSAIGLAARRRRIM